MFFTKIAFNLAMLLFISLFIHVVVNKQEQSGYFGEKAIEKSEVKK